MTRIHLPELKKSAGQNWLKPSYLSILLILLSVHQGTAGSLDSLRSQLGRIAAGKRAVMGIAVSSYDGRDTVSVNGSRWFPMQSVFKFHIGLAVLSRADRGHLSLDQPVSIQGPALLPELYSPIRDLFPEGAILPLRDVLAFTVSQSDNAGCDALLRLAGGPEAVEDYFHEKGFRNLTIAVNEETMQGNWDLQFKNQTTPLGAVEVLRAFSDTSQNLLSPESYRLIWQLMKQTTTGPNRLKGLLPPGTEVAHKTGWSGTHPETGITAAVNDIGILFLPDGHKVFISVFVTESREPIEVNERLIAEAARVVWDFYVPSGN